MENKQRIDEIYISNILSSLMQNDQKILDIIEKNNIEFDKNKKIKEIIKLIEQHIKINEKILKQLQSKVNEVNIKTNEEISMIKNSCVDVPNITLETNNKNYQNIYKKEGNQLLHVNNQSVNNKTLTLAIRKENRNVSKSNLLSIINIFSDDNVQKSKYDLNVKNQDIDLRMNNVGSIQEEEINSTPLINVIDTEKDKETANLLSFINETNTKEDNGNDSSVSIINVTNTEEGKINNNSTPLVNVTDIEKKEGKSNLMPVINVTNTEKEEGKRNSIPIFYITGTEKEGNIKYNSNNKKLNGIPSTNLNTSLYPDNRNLYSPNYNSSISNHSFNNNTTAILEEKSNKLNILNNNNNSNENFEPQTDKSPSSNLDIDFELLSTLNQSIGSNDGKITLPKFINLAWKDFSKKMLMGFVTYILNPPSKLSISRQIHIKDITNNQYTRHLSISDPSNTDIDMNTYHQKSDPNSNNVSPESFYPVRVNANWFNTYRSGYKKPLFIPGGYEIELFQQNQSEISNNEQLFYSKLKETKKCCFSGETIISLLSKGASDYTSFSNNYILPLSTDHFFFCLNKKGLYHLCDELNHSGEDHIFIFSETTTLDVLNRCCAMFKACLISGFTGNSNIICVFPHWDDDSSFDSIQLYSKIYSNDYCYDDVIIGGTFKFIFHLFTDLVSNHFKSTHTYYSTIRLNGSFDQVDGIDIALPSTMDYSVFKKQKIKTKTETETETETENETETKIEIETETEVENTFEDYSQWIDSLSHYWINDPTSWYCILSSPCSQLFNVQDLMTAYWYLAYVTGEVSSPWGNTWMNGYSVQQQKGIPQVKVILSSYASRVGKLKGFANYRNTSYVSSGTINAKSIYHNLNLITNLQFGIYSGYITHIMGGFGNYSYFRDFPKFVDYLKAMMQVSNYIIIPQSFSPVDKSLSHDENNYVSFRCGVVPPNYDTKSPLVTMKTWDSHPNANIWYRENKRISLKPRTLLYIEYVPKIQYWWDHYFGDIDSSYPFFINNYHQRNVDGYDECMISLNENAGTLALYSLKSNNLLSSIIQHYTISVYPLSRYATCVRYDCPELWTNTSLIPYLKISSLTFGQSEYPETCKRYIYLSDENKK